MDVLVMVEEHPGHSRVLAHVNSVPSHDATGDGWREIVTMFGAPTPDALALALAAAVEGRPAGGAPRAGAVRHLGVWSDRGAIGDAAWRDTATGEIVSEDLDVPLAMLQQTAGRLLSEGGQMIRRVAGSLCLQDRPEGARRAFTVSLGPLLEATSATRAQLENVLDRLREADALSFEYEGD